MMKQAEVEMNMDVWVFQDSETELNIRLKNKQPCFIHQCLKLKYTWQR